jgi:hypothetical protein
VTPAPDARAADPAPQGSGAHDHGPATRHDVTLVLVLHDHQPVGNFDDVVAGAYRDAYAPFLDFLERNPALRIALHTSGPLLEWLDQHEPGYLERLRARVQAGQVEPWGGGFYEPILPAIPERDRHAQILLMADWLERRFGVRPRGLWLTERVWEPGLASSLAAAGVEYTAVDDAHFVAAGFERDALWGTFLTEDQGEPVRIFPIHRELRYLIPFGEPAAIVARLAELSAEGPGHVAVLGDDGEKFGLWPGTHRLCYEQGWLARFTAAIAAEPWIRLRTPAEAVAAHEPLGLAYLPTGSYHEMQEWSLPPASQARYHAAAESLAAAGGEHGADLLRGGHWRNFLARYPESNRLHKRMLRASRRIGAAGVRQAGRDEAQRHLWRSQCNCPYWHGVFGGLYLPHLRSAAWRELIEAESWDARGKNVEVGDLDLDGTMDAVIESPASAVWISARGGRVWGLDDRRRVWNWCDTLGQRREHYHSLLERAALASETPAGAAPTASIHADIKLKEPGLVEQVAAYRTHDRDLFLDLWSEDGQADTNRSETRGMLAVEGGGIVFRVDESAAPAIEKGFRLAADGPLEVRYVLSSTRPRSGTLTVEINAAIHVPAAEDRWIEVDGRRADPPEPHATARHTAVRSAAFVDAWAGRRLDVSTDREATLARAPIDTVSLSESGAERVFQGVETRWSFPVTLAPGAPWIMTFRLAPNAEPAA